MTAPDFQVENAREAALAETVRRECAESLSDISYAIRHPRTSRDYLVGAIKSLKEAYAAAWELDPPEKP